MMAILTMSTMMISIITSIGLDIGVGVSIGACTCCIIAINMVMLMILLLPVLLLLDLKKRHCLGVIVEVEGLAQGVCLLYLTGLLHLHLHQHQHQIMLPLLHLHLHLLSRLFSLAPSKERVQGASSFAGR